ncbi:MAG TPA: NUDIX hydrolase [Nitrospira sp.]|nr:NUDIX hydrolase [Nitrospira sp.]
MSNPRSSCWRTVSRPRGQGAKNRYFVLSIFLSLRLRWSGGTGSRCDKGLRRDSEVRLAIHGVGRSMNYCTACGKPVQRQIPPGDNLPRFVCGSCELIHYHNPKIVAGCIPQWEDHILLCRRAIEPNSGLWTFPAGFMELGESTEQAAVRETVEEARADVTLVALHSVLSLPHIGQVYIVFVGDLKVKQFEAGPESLEVRLFRPSEIPWDSIAFPVVEEALRRYVDDMAKGELTLHVANIPEFRN